jgi:hypothetical protein
MLITATNHELSEIQCLVCNVMCQNVSHTIALLSVRRCVPLCQLSKGEILRRLHLGRKWLCSSLMVYLMTAAQATVSEGSHCITAKYSCTKLHNI